MKGNKTMFEDEARDMGIDLIRNNKAPIGGPFGHGDTYEDIPFNRGGFRDFGDVGVPAFLPNGQPIEYKDLNLPKGLTGLLGIGGNKGKEGEDAPNFATFVGPPQQLKRGDKGWIKGGNRPDTLNFWDTGVGRNLDELGDALKGVLAPQTIPWLIAQNLRETIDPNHPDYNYKIANAVRARLGDRATNYLGGGGGKTTLSILGTLAGAGR